MVGPAQPFYWKVLSSSCSEATVPSVCFLVPPPNQEAQEAIARCVVLGMQLERVVSGGSPDASDCAPTWQAGGPAPGLGCVVAPAAHGNEEPSGVAEPQP